MTTVIEITPKYMRTELFRMTQLELAECLGVSARTVARHESGDSLPPKSTLLALERIAQMRGIKLKAIHPAKGTAPAL